VVFYAITQGAHFLALSYLPAQTTSLLLSFAPVIVALVGVMVLAERPTGRQWSGVGLYLAGAAVFLYPAAFVGGELVGIAVATICLLASAGGTIIGRAVNRRATLSPLTVTAIGMGIGALALLVSGVTIQGMPALAPSAWLLVGWLAVVNTALAFTLWNLTQRTLSAVESSIVNNTMLIQIAVLAWIFLGERLGVKEITGLTVAALGVLLVQLGAVGRRTTKATVHEGQLAGDR
jgi:drug/metabolite transporter (DMT)-like permease